MYASVNNPPGLTTGGIFFGAPTYCVRGNPKLLLSDQSTSNARLHMAAILAAQ